MFHSRSRHGARGKRQEGALASRPYPSPRISRQLPNWCIERQLLRSHWGEMRHSEIEQGARGKRQGAIYLPLTPSSLPCARFQERHILC